MLDDDPDSDDDVEHWESLSSLLHASFTDGTVSYSPAPPSLSTLKVVTRNLEGGINNGKLRASLRDMAAGDYHVGIFTEVDADARARRSADFEVGRWTTTTGSRAFRVTWGDNPAATQRVCIVTHADLPILHYANSPCGRAVLITAQGLRGFCLDIVGVYAPSGDQPIAQAALLTSLTAWAHDATQRKQPVLLGGDVNGVYTIADRARVDGSAPALLQYDGVASLPCALSLLGFVDQYTLSWPTSRQYTYEHDNSLSRIDGFWLLAPPAVHRRAFQVGVDTARTFAGGIRTRHSAVVWHCHFRSWLGGTPGAVLQPPPPRPTFDLSLLDDPATAAKFSASALSAWQAAPPTADNTARTERWYTAVLNSATTHLTRLPTGGAPSLSILEKASRTINDSAHKWRSLVSRQRWARASRRLSKLRRSARLLGVTVPHLATDSATP